MALAICFFHLIPESTVGWAAIWNDKPWPLAEFVGRIGLPQTQWILASALVLAYLGIGGLVFGFLTRISAALLLLGAVASGFLAVKQESVEGLELSIIYGIATLSLVLRGAGSFAGDHFFQRRRAE